MRLAELKTTYFDPKEKHTFVVSFGATEQHGPFLPLGTDSYCQNAILKKVIKYLPEVIFLPTLDITCSREHRGFLGTVWIEKETMKMTLRDICNSLKDYAKNIVFISWHGGNLAIIDQFINEYGATLKNVSLHHVNTDDEETLKRTEEMIGGPVDEHAGNTEISMMLAIDKMLVKIPPKKYHKHHIKNAWSDAPLKDKSKDGIVDNHPKWVIDKKMGKKFIDFSAEQIKRDIQKIIA